MFIERQLIQLNKAAERIRDNASGQKVHITVGQSLLMLIDACNQEELEPEILEKLKELYLCGVKSAAEEDFVINLKNWLADKKNLNVSFDPKLINDDPTRRYFETHLSYHMLAPNAERLDLDTLKKIKQSLQSELEKHLNDCEKIKWILQGTIDKKLITEKKLNKYEEEYATLIHQLSTHQFHGLSETACDRLCEIARITIIATLNTQHDDAMPADIYAESIFTMGIDGRGRRVKAKHDQVLSIYQGLMLTKSPLPRGDIAGDGGEITYEETVEAQDVQEPTKKTSRTIHRVRINPSPFQRSADQATFIIESQWSQHLFARLTQIYSNGISSTTLATLRNLLMLKRQNHPYYQHDFANYMSAFAALMIYNSGGHSIFEIFEVMKLPQLSELLEATNYSETLSNDRLMEEWLLHAQESVFNQALDETIAYTQTLIQRKIVNAHIESTTRHGIKLKNEKGIQTEVSDKLGINISPKHIPSTEQMSGAELLNLDIAQFQERIKALTPAVLNTQYPSGDGYSLVLAAAQMGKLEHLKTLISKGADITQPFTKKVGKTTQTLTALDLAIKSKRYPVVHYLLSLKDGTNKKFPLIGKKTTATTLQERAPSLFFACRQDDLRILKEVLARDKLNPSDKLLVLKELITFENSKSVAMFLTDFLSKEDLRQVSAAQKNALLEHAIGTGKDTLVQSLLGSHIAPDKLAYEKMLLKACKRNYLPVIRTLLSHARDKNMQLTETQLNHIMLTALKNGYYDLTILTIAYGANPEAIHIKNPNLSKLTRYLRTVSPEHFNVFFTNADKEMIAKRTTQMQELHANRTTGPWNIFINFLINFLNILPFVNLGGYYDKQETINRLTHQIITKEPKTDEEIGYGTTSPEERRPGFSRFFFHNRAPQEPGNKTPAAAVPPSSNEVKEAKPLRHKAPKKSAGSKKETHEKVVTKKTSTETADTTAMSSAYSYSELLFNKRQPYEDTEPSEGYVIAPSGIKKK